MRSVYKEFSYLCKNNHITKSWQWHTTTTIKCTTCNEDSSMLIFTRSRDAQDFKPPIVAYNPKTKEYRHLAGPLAKPPKGFEAVELRTRNDIDKCYKYLDSVDKRIYDERKERESQMQYEDPYRDYQQKTQIGAMFEDYCKDMASREYRPSFRGSNFIEAFEFDKSNID